MARHTNIYNALFSFYKASIDDIKDDLIDAKVKNDSLRFNDLESSMSSEIEAVICLARDQAVHLYKTNVIKKWEEGYLIEDTASYAMKAVKKLKSEKTISTYKKMDIGKIMNDAEFS